MKELSPPTTEDSLSCWIDWMANWHPVGIDLGLDRVRQVYQHTRFRKMAHSIPTIVVGGTNGKGSVTAYLASISRQAGLSVGVYRSPHIERFNERFLVDNDQVSDQALINAFAEVVEIAQRLDLTLSSFEIMTLASLALFAAASVDLAVLEVGLGGRLDAVNILDPLISIVTTVGIDHEEWLGSDREKIGWEKAHIFRENRPAIVGDRAMPEKLRTYATELPATLYNIQKDFELREIDDGKSPLAFYIKNHQSGRQPLWANLPIPGIPGHYQRDNAACALAAMASLSDAGLSWSHRITESAVRQGLAQASLPGRLQRLSVRDQVWLIDVGHNPDAAIALADYLRSEIKWQSIPAIMGVMADKDIASIVNALNGVISTWHVVDLPIERAATAKFLSAQIESQDKGAMIAQHASVADAICAVDAQLSTVEGVNQTIDAVVFGSFHTVAEALPILRNIHK